MVAPDETTFAYLNGRRFAPQGVEWERSVADWRGLRSDPARASIAKSRSTPRRSNRW